MRRGSMMKWVLKNFVITAAVMNAVWAYASVEYDFNTFPTGRLTVRKDGVFTIRLRISLLSQS